MSVISVPVEAVEPLLQTLIGYVEGLWNAAFIYKRKWEEKKSYAKATLQSIEGFVERTGKDHHLYSRVQEMKRLYQPRIEFADLERYVTLIEKERKYDEVMKELEEISKDLRANYEQKGARGSYWSRY